MEKIIYRLNEEHDFRNPQVNSFCAHSNPNSQPPILFQQLCNCVTLCTKFNGKLHCAGGGGESGLCEYVIAHTILPPSAVILWIELGGKSKWLPLNFGYHDIMHTAPIVSLISACKICDQVSHQLTTTSMQILPLLIYRYWVTQGPRLDTSNFFFSRQTICSEYMALLHLAGAEVRDTGADTFAWSYYSCCFPNLHKQSTKPYSESNCSIFAEDPVGELYRQSGISEVSNSVVQESHAWSANLDAAAGR